MNKLQFKTIWREIRLHNGDRSTAVAEIGHPELVGLAYGYGRAIVDDPTAPGHRSVEKNSTGMVYCRQWRDLRIAGPIGHLP